MRSDFARIYAKVQRIQKLDNVSMLKNQNMEVRHSNLNNLGESEKSSCDSNEENVNQKLLKDKLISKRNTIIKENLTFNIFMLKIRDIKLIYEIDKYNYLISMIIECEENNNELVESWEINDVMAKCVNDENIAEDYYQQLNKLVSENSLDHILNEIDKYLINILATMENK